MPPDNSQGKHLPNSNEGPALGCSQCQSCGLQHLQTSHISSVHTAQCSPERPRKTFQSLLHHLLLLADAWSKDLQQECEGKLSRHTDPRPGNHNLILGTQDLLCALTSLEGCSRERRYWQDFRNEGV